MDITLEQARVFEAVARLGTVQKAAAELHRGHSAVLYSLKNLEQQTGLVLFDRGGHRNQVSGEGQIVLRYCRKLIAARDELIDVCQNLKNTWEPSLKLIYDGVVDFNDIGDALYRLNEMKAPTEVKVLSAHLHEVRGLFEQENADIMLTVVPLPHLKNQSHKLSPIRLRLVAHRDHPLGAQSRGRLSIEDLNRHTYINIKTPSAVGLSTDPVEFDSVFSVNGFVVKKTAILKKLGFGWLPDYMIKDELRKGQLQILRTELDNEHVLQPRLYHRDEEFMGKATRKLLEFLKS